MDASNCTSCQLNETEAKTANNYRSSSEQPSSSGPSSSQQTIVATDSEPPQNPAPSTLPQENVPVAVADVEALNGRNGDRRSRKQNVVDALIAWLILVTFTGVFASVFYGFSRI
jgi:hypothetical protein